jgi:hypothetical protein
MELEEFHLRVSEARKKDWLNILLTAMELCENQLLKVRNGIGAEVVAPRQAFATAQSSALKIQRAKHLAEVKLSRLGRSSLTSMDKIPRRPATRVAVTPCN